MKLTPEKQKKLAISVVSMIVAAGCLYYFLVMGLQGNQTTGEAEREGLLEKIKKSETAYQVEKNHRTESIVYQNFLKSYGDKMPGKGVNPDTWLLQHFTEMAARYDLKISNTESKPLPDLAAFKFKGVPYTILGYHLEFKGEFNQIGRFIEAIENSNPLMEVDELSITTGSGGGEHIHTVTMRVSMVIQS